MKILKKLLGDKVVNLLLFSILIATASCQNLIENQYVSDLQPDSTLEKKDLLMEEEPSFQIDSVIDTALLQLRLSPKGTYSRAKSKIIEKRTDFQSKYKEAQTELEKEAILIKASYYLTESLINEIIPHWYGTPWDFSGYTAKPNDGEVGCSYFVSTTLLHAGFKLNRYRLAQQGPQSEAKSIQLADSLHIIETNSVDVLRESIAQNFGDGLFFVGLEHSHVGYLLLRKGQLFFLQSSYVDPVAVVIEKAELSPVLMSYYTFAIAEITSNKELIRRWIMQEEVKVVMGKD